MTLRLSALAACLASLLPACADGTAPPTEPAPGAAEGDLGLGLVEDMKDDGNWGAALTCKPIPRLTPLADPMIVVSLDGLTLRLFDRAGAYDKVFPIGPGAFENGKSLTPLSTGRPDQVFHTRTDLPQAFDGPTPAQQVWSWNHACRMWWKDEAGRQIPVFAGLPFIRLEGPPTASYAIHGPIDQFTQPNGGTLRRGFVSHGCVRMAAADVVEVYALIQGHRTPVRVQQAIERRDDGRAVDIAARWVGSECRHESDCAFQGGFCATNAWSGRGFCSARCTQYCADRPGAAPTFCVADPAAPGEGLCVPKSTAVDGLCTRYDHLVTKRATPRFNQPRTVADVCLPGTEGWMGDRCLTDAECAGGLCVPPGDGQGAGICSQTCSRTCPDRANAAGTFCVAAPSESGLSGGLCAATCTTNDDCALGATCELEPRFGQPSVTRGVCLPY